MHLGKNDLFNLYTQGHRRHSGWGGHGRSTFSASPRGVVRLAPHFRYCLIIHIILVSRKRMIDRGSVEKIPGIEARLASYIHVAIVFATQINSETS